MTRLRKGSGKALKKVREREGRNLLPQDVKRGSRCSGCQVVEECYSDCYIRCSTEEHE